MEQNFYSSRKERLSQASSATKKAYAKRNSGSYFKRNPHMKVLIIDLILVLLFGVVIVPFFVRITKDIRFDDYKVQSKAIIFEEKILVSVKVSKLYKNISNRIATDKVKVVIIENENILDSSLSDLPTKPGEDKYITFKLDNIKDQKIITLELSSGDFLKNYKVNIQH